MPDFKAIVLIYFCKTSKLVNRMFRFFKHVSCAVNFQNTVSILQSLLKYSVWQIFCFCSLIFVFCTFGFKTKGNSQDYGCAFEGFGFNTQLKIQMLNFLNLLKECTNRLFFVVVENLGPELMTHKITSSDPPRLAVVFESFVIIFKSYYWCQIQSVIRLINSVWYHLLRFPLPLTNYYKSILKTLLNWKDAIEYHLLL